MDDPLRQAWMYLIAGVAAVGASIYFIATADQANGSFGVLDYAILGMGVVAIYRGVKGFLALRGGAAGAAGPSTQGTRRIGRAGDGPDEDPRKSDRSEDS